MAYIPALFAPKTNIKKRNGCININCLLLIQYDSTLSLLKRTEAVGLVITGGREESIHPVVPAVFHPDFQMMNTVIVVSSDGTHNARCSFNLSIGGVWDISYKFFN